MAKLNRFLAPVLAAGFLAASANAYAGNLHMRDEAHVFSAGDADALRGVVARAPFDARLVTTSAYPNQAGFSRYVGSLVAEPNMVVVGIDPQHRHVQVHFGTGTHIPQAAWPDIEHAGNDAFKRGAWEEGGADVFRAAERAVTASGGAAVTPSASQGVSLLGPLVLVLLVGGVLVAVVMFARRRSQGFVGGGYGGPGYGAPGPYNGGGGPYYGPGGQPGGMGPLGGGIIGAGLGGLAGYELGKMEGERERERDFGGDRGGFDGGGGNYDAGGGGSSWDDSGGSGGGSDFDSGGGGFDGGGGDSGGGGGSDF